MRPAFPRANRRDLSEPAVVVVFSTVALLVHLLTNGRHGYFRDELYYIACGRHLAFGYVDQPPLSIFASSIEPTIFCGYLAIGLAKSF
jgi:hypothetical protein